MIIFVRSFLLILISFPIYGFSSTPSTYSVSDLNKWSLELYKKSFHSSENLIFSPYSIHLSLSTLYLGSTSFTKSEIKRSLVFPDDPESLLAFHKVIKDQLYSSPSMSKKFTLDYSLWFQKDFKLKNSFVESRSGYAIYSFNNCFIFFTSC